MPHRVRCAVQPVHCNCSSCHLVADDPGMQRNFSMNEKDRAHTGGFPSWLATVTHPSCHEFDQFSRSVLVVQEALAVGGQLVVIIDDKLSTLPVTVNLTSAICGGVIFLFNMPWPAVRETRMPRAMMTISRVNSTAYDLNGRCGHTVTLGMGTLLRAKLTPLLLQSHHW